MAKKYRLPADVKASAIGYVQGYQRRRQEYKIEYNNIVNSSSANFETYKETVIAEDGKEKQIECRYFGTRPVGMSGNPTERKAFALAMLDARQDTLLMKAVERARDLIGDRIYDDEVRDALVRGIFKNIIEGGRRAPYENMDLPTIGRNEFFEERRRFLYYVAKFSGLIS